MEKLLYLSMYLDAVSVGLASAALVTSHNLVFLTPIGIGSIGFVGAVVVLNAMGGLK